MKEDISISSADMLTVVTGVLVPQCESIKTGKEPRVNRTPNICPDVDGCIPVCLCVCRIRARESKALLYGNTHSHNNKLAFCSENRRPGWSAKSYTLVQFSNTEIEAQVLSLGMICQHTCISSRRQLSLGNQCGFHPQLPKLIVDRNVSIRVMEL